MIRPIVKVGTPGLGLALSGGGLKGVAHIGVLQVLEENGIRPRMIAGTSAGAIVAALYAAGVRPGEMEEIALKLSDRDILDWSFGVGTAFWVALQSICGGISVLVDHVPEGLLKGKRLQQLVRQLTGRKRIDQITMPLAIVATDVDTGERVIFTNWRQAPNRPVNRTCFIREVSLDAAVRASMAIPGVFEPIRLGGRILVDGGITDNIPTEVLAWMGADPIVAVNLGFHQPQQKAENILNVLMRSLDILVSETSDVELKHYSNLVITPPISGVGLGDVEKIADCIKIGVESTRQALPVIRKLLEPKAANL